ncbi:MAG: NAD-dependent epimerase/dehydratase family protein [Verrucomicrobiota bacterium]
MNPTPLSVLVTGSSGFIGTYVVRSLHAAGHRVTGLDQIPPKDPLPEGVAFHVCDIRQGELPDRTFDAVVHLAALAGVRPSLDRPMEYETTNVVGTIRMLEFCRRMGVPQFVFASSSSVYGPDTPLPAEESTPANPCSPYALTKLHGEQWGRLYARLHGLRFLALRFFSVWGPGQRPDLALESFRRRIEAGQPVIINGDGTQRRDLTHIADVARAVELALRWRGPGAVVLNVGTGRNHSVMDMLAAARKAATPAVEHQAPHPADVPETLASITAAEAQLGWQPRIFFPDEPDY